MRQLLGYFSSAQKNFGQVGGELGQSIRGKLQEAQQEVEQLKTQGGQFFEKGRQQAVQHLKDLQQQTQSRINELSGKTDSQSKSELQALQRGQQDIQNLLQKLSNGQANAGESIGGGSGSFNAGF